MTLPQYLATTRVSKGHPAPHLVEIYKRLFHLIQPYIPEEGKRLELEVTYSTNKTAELLHLNGTDYLIYDQYLGQVFSMLNRLFFNSKNERESWYYSYKLLAEELQINGHPKAALILALAYRENIDKSSSYKQDVDLAKRMLYTTAQELFIILHEITHMCTFEGKRNNYAKSVRETTLDMLIDKFKASDEDPKIEEGITEQMLGDEFRTLYGETFERAKMGEENFKEYKLDQRKASENWTDILKETAKNSDQLIDELVCDDIASNIVVEIMKKEFKMPVSDVLDAVYLCLLHLRTLGILHAQASNFFSNDSKELAKFQNDSHIRLMRNRDRANYIYQQHTGSSKKAIELQKKLVDTNNHYYKSLLDAILYKTQRGVDILKQRAQKFEQSHDIESFDRDNETVDMVLNVKRA